MKQPGNRPNSNQNPLMRPQRRVWLSKLDEAQKTKLAESKWIVVIAVTLLVFLFTGGYRFLNPAELHEHFLHMASATQQTNVWVNFLLTFGIAGAFMAAILSTAVVNYLSHSKRGRN
jgi:protein-S-isoprenylcysteine O-methyltransferase Ste14